MVTPEGEDAVMLTLAGVYRPPLRKLGAVLDRAVLSRVALATVRDFLDRLGAVIQDSSADAAERGTGESRG
jgi:hypothetical protein